MDFIESDSECINPINSKISKYSERWKERQKLAIKCPTCGSTNLEMLSDTKRGAHAIAFDIFSNTIQMKAK